jgi:hypothetical protein
LGYLQIFAAATDDEAEGDELAVGRHAAKSGKLPAKQQIINMILFFILVFP